MKKELIDYDLDVSLALKNFPENDQDGYIYLRVDRSNSTFTHMSLGSPESLGQAIMAAICEDKTMANIVINVAEQYLNYVKGDRALRTKSHR